MTAFLTCPTCGQQVDHNNILTHMAAHGDKTAQGIIDTMNDFKEFAHLKHFDVKDLVSDQDMKEIEREIELAKMGVVDTRDDFCERVPLEDLQHIIINHTKKKIMLFHKPKGVLIVDFTKIRYLRQGEAAFIHDDPPP